MSTAVVIEMNTVNFTSEGRRTYLISLYSYILFLLYFVTIIYRSPDHQNQRNRHLKLYLYWAKTQITKEIFVA